MPLALEWTAEQWGDRKGPAPVISNVSNLNEQRAAVLNSGPLSSHALSVIAAGREATLYTYKKAGAQLTDAQLLVDFLIESRRPLE